MKVNLFGRSEMNISRISSRKTNSKTVIFLHFPVSFAAASRMCVIEVTPDLTDRIPKTWVKPFLLCCCNSADVTTVSFHLQHLELILGPCVKLSHWLTVQASLVTYIPQRITSDAFSSLWSTLATFPAVSDHQFFWTSSLSVTNEDTRIPLNIMCPFLIPEVVCCGQLGCVCFLKAWTQPQLDFGYKLLI